MRINIINLGLLYMSKDLISEKAFERPHTIRAHCKYIPVKPKDYGEYQQDKKDGIMNHYVYI